MDDVHAHVLQMKYRDNGCIVISVDRSSLGNWYPNDDMRQHHLQSNSDPSYGDYDPIQHYSASYARGSHMD